MVELAEAVEAGRVHMVSSIAAAGLYKGTWREDMFEEAENLDTHPYFRTKHDSEAVVRTECSRPWRVYRPGIVVGHSETGEMDKIDGPYYFFKLIRRLRNAVPQWIPMIGVEGREINLVPVDFVARAMDHIAHLDGLDGQAFHLTDPSPRTAGEVIDIFARAAHAPQSSARVPPVAVEALAPLLKGLVMLPPAGLVADSVLSDFGIPRSVLTYVNYPTSFDSRQAQAALSGTDIRVPPLEAYADKLWDYWERHLDPDLFRDRTLVGAVRGRAGAVGGATQVIEQQIPDELLRLARRVLGTVSLEQAVRGRVVMVTGASSGNRALGGAEDRRRRRHRAARRPHPREARGDQGADREAAAARPTSIAAICPTWTTSTGWPTRSSPSTATWTSWSTTRGARSAARSPSPTTASTTSSAPCSSTTSAR